MSVVQRCPEEARIQDEQGNDGGGHWSCLTPLVNGECPNARNHHSVWVAEQIAAEASFLVKVSPSA